MRYLCKYYITDSDVVEEDEDRSYGFGYFMLPYLVEDGRVVGVMRKIFCFEKHD